MVEASVGGAQRMLVAVADADPAADVERADGADPDLAQPVDQLQQPADAFGVWAWIEQLAPDVHRDGVEREQRMFPDGQGERHDLVHRNPELDSALAGRDVRMGIGGDIRIDPDADPHRAPEPRGDPAERGQLGGGLEVHMADPRLDRGGQLLVGLADAAEDDALGLESRGERAGQLPAGNDVGARAKVAKQPEHGQVRVGLHRVGDPVRHRRQRFVQAPGTAGG